MGGFGRSRDQVWEQTRVDLSHFEAPLESAFIVLIDAAETWGFLKKIDTVHAVFRKLNLTDV